ncbi:diacylglycerol/lipid kinase family protein [Microlunatus flavus]|uniref:Diacylglycerol kinase family enzyme n=1 Tax=Microlunatus flavus TaxID=1036181 RepID=A0A1H9NFC2_9ACTN|nr:diacylglycerol kinase family protein [Microlunatus flavus]SER34684.1 Diacylglycerol kinase family enzyme [Microlunatus flavus]
MTLRCAVVANPTKLGDADAALVREGLAAAGCPEPLWLETSADDPGRSMTQQAVDAGVDLVIAAGGDGTIRLVAAGLAGTDIAMAIIPAGTGNLLARNLEIPLDVAGALSLALGDEERRIDTVVLRVDGGEPDRFAVMAGTGLDAMIMEGVDERLKKFIGPGAYFLSAAKALGRLPVPVQVTVDGKRHRRKAIITVIGNCGELTGDLELIPGAQPDDGQLYVYVAFPSRPTHWIKAFIRLVTRRPQKDDHVEVWAGRKVEIRLQAEDAYELDGDVEGEGTVLTGEVDPGSLRIRARPPHRVDQPALNAS